MPTTNFWFAGKVAALWLTCRVDEGIDRWEAMSFQESAESWRAKLQVSHVRLPVLLGITTMVLLVLCGAGKMLFDVVTADGFAFESSAGEELGTQVGESSEGPSMPKPQMLRIHVGGAVVTPGVYEVPDGSCVIDVVNVAGGFAEDAASDALNLARKVTDGEQVLVPNEANADPARSDDITAGTLAGAGAGSVGTLTSGKVNINTASAAQLDALPGVGASTAEKIIADRDANGPFKVIEDLKRVSGIGDKKFAALSGVICVG